MTGPDAIMLSYDEPLASVLHARLELVLRRPVKRLHGVTGMRRAYRLCAEIADGSEFLLADGDFEIAAGFDARSVTLLDAGVAMRVWQTVNPVNGLVYGYGGLKLISRAALRELGDAVDDMAVIDAALSRTGLQFSLLVAGAPVDQAMLCRWRAIPGLRVHAIDRPVAEDELRQVYAAAGITLVARRPGVGKESGLVADAARLGVPLLISGHDPALTACLAGQEWVRVFEAASAGSLAAALRELAACPLPRPGPQAAAVIGVHAAADQAAYLIRACPAREYR